MATRAVLVNTAMVAALQSENSMTAAYLYNPKNGEYEMETEVEKVLVISSPANDIDFSLFTSCVCRDKLKAWATFQNIMKSNNLMFISREFAETEESMLQIIPYVILTHKGKIFAYQRTKKSGEKRLHGNWSIGVGGHINPVDITGVGAIYPNSLSVDSNSMYWNAVFRELKEEVGAVPEKIELCGLIFDPSNAVGRVHLGIVHVAEVNHTIRPIENTMGAHGFFTWEELVKSNNLSFENWTKLLLESGLDI